MEGSGALPKPHLADHDQTTWYFFANAYVELRRLAARAMRSEWASHSLQKTALVHEVFLRMLGGGQTWSRPADFLSAAAKEMRQILIEHARRRKALKRWGHLTPVDGVDMVSFDSKLERVLHLNEVLSKLAKIDSRSASVVEMRVFLGLTQSEIGELLGVGEKTVERDWLFARAWLRKALSE